MILKNRHPEADFGVIEDELRRFEAERLATVSKAEKLREESEELK